LIGLLIFAELRLRLVLMVLKKKFHLLPVVKVLLIIRNMVRQ